MNDSCSYLSNASLISNDEEAMAQRLLHENLSHANQVQNKVMPKSSFYTRVGKRLLDIVLSSMACIILAPFNAVFAICTYWDVGMPILFKQGRCGKDGKEFVLVKFRNMNNDTDENGILLPAAQRVTRFGRIMRKYSLDELLNFWSVLKGDMSIIGPRPLPVFFYERMSDRHKMRVSVRPGLECPRMLSFENDNLCNYHKQFENDIWYVEHISFFTDLKMCFMLIKMVFDLRNRDDRAKGKATSFFVGYDEDGFALSMDTASKRYHL